MGVNFNPNVQTTKIQGPQQQGQESKGTQVNGDKQSYEGFESGSKFSLKNANGNTGLSYSDRKSVV